MTSATPLKRPYAARMAPSDRREQLLDVAQATALERGFHAVTIDGVARAAGVTRPVVYGLFADRGELLAALLSRAEARALSQLAPALPAVPGPEDYVDPDALLVDGVSAYLSAVRDDPDTWRVILLPPEGAPPELADRLHGVHRDVLRELRMLVAWGMDRRGGAALDVDLFARGVLTLAEGAARLLLEQPDRYPVERFRAFTEDLLAGLVRA
ncbi:MAG: TetR/AcrR family transcriptional regulator [Frankiaceae bacterium]|nr:TetR/AcrR family transcriptional regulator [Frankiaceae bacterium]